MNAELLNCGCAALAPVLCWLWQAAHERRWPVIGGQRGAAAAGVIVACVFTLQCVAIGRATHSIALALTLPLAAISLAGSAYVPCVRAWPRVTVTAAWLLAAAGGMLVGLAIVAG